MNDDRPTVVLATDPDGALHVLATSVRTIDGRAGLADLEGRAADVHTGGGPRLSSLLTATRLRDESALCDVFAHLVPAREPAGEPLESVEDVAVVVQHMTRAAPLPEVLDGPLGRRFVVESSGPPGALDGRALLLASRSVSGGPWWAPIGAVPQEVLALGALLAHAGAFGEGARVSEASDFDARVATWLTDNASHVRNAAAQFQQALHRMTRGEVAEPVVQAHEGPTAAAAPSEPFTVQLHDEGDVRRVVVSLNDDTPSDETRASFEWVCARWLPAAVLDLERARRDRLAPYWLLVFDGPVGAEHVLTRAISGRRSLAMRGAIGARDRTAQGATT